MNNLEFAKWKNILWRFDDNIPIAYCPKHKQRLEIITTNRRAFNQLQSNIPLQSHLICTVDNERFDIDGDNFATMIRRFKATVESDSLKNATYRDLDNIYTPVLKVSPKPKDDRYSVQVEIDDTPNGKKMVIYAMDRQNPSEKTQIFIDPKNDKISFDSNDLHPNMIFSKITAEFKENKKVTIEQRNKY